MKQVLIIGAGPAGMAAAISARQRGFAVTVVERESAEKEKICGDGLTKKCVSVLNSLGVTPMMLRQAGAHEIKSSIHEKPDHTKQVILHNPGTCFTLRRYRLMALLRERAANMGATILYNTTYSESMASDHVIDAAGCQCASFRLSRKLPVGLSVIIKAKANTPLESMYFFHHKENDNGYCWVFPLSDGLWNIGIWEEKSPEGMKSAFDQFLHNYLYRHCTAVEYVRKPTGAFLGTYQERPPIAPGAVLCGDAAGLCDIGSGEGISYAMASGIEAVKSIVL